MSTENENVRVDIGEEFSPFTLPKSSHRYGACSGVDLITTHLFPEILNPEIKIFLFEHFSTPGHVEFNPYTGDGNLRRIPSLTRDFTRSGKKLENRQGMYLFDFLCEDLLPASLFQISENDSSSLELKPGLKDRLMRLKLNLKFPSAYYKEYEVGFYETDLDSPLGLGFHNFRLKSDEDSYVNSLVNKNERLVLVIPENKISEVKASFIIEYPESQQDLNNPFRLAFPELF